MPPPSAASPNLDVSKSPDEEGSPAIFGLPLYAWVLIAVALAFPVGLFLGQDATAAQAWPNWARSVAGAFVTLLELFPTLILRALTALAGPLVVLAILSAIITNEIHGRQGARMMVYYLINTLVAMFFGLLLTYLIQPGRESRPNASANAGQTTSAAKPARLIDLLGGTPPSAKKLPEGKTVKDLITEIVPRNLFDALLQNNLAQLVLFTLAAAIALSRIRDQQQASGETAYLAVVNVVTVGFELLMKILLWVVALVPLAVFGVVATSLAREGLELFKNLGLFIVTVLIGLSLQMLWYLGQLGLFAKMSPRRFLRGAADVMATTFSTASTAATMPVTLRCLQSKLGVSRQSSQLAACVGTNFNNDGTALYQAVAALYFAQTQGLALDLSQQLIIVASTLLASVGAGGIPSGSFVTMPLILAAVNLSPEKLPILLTVDWFLDRCRTTSNVVGDMTVAILLDRTRTTDQEA